MILLLALALTGALPDPTTAADPPVPERVHLALTIPEDEHVCDPALAIDPWRDASEPVSFATDPTARQDEQELWAATSMSPLLACRWRSRRSHWCSRCTDGGRSGRSADRRCRKLAGAGLVDGDPRDGT